MTGSPPPDLEKQQDPGSTNNQRSDTIASSFTNSNNDEPINSNEKRGNTELTAETGSENAKKKKKGLFGKKSKKEEEKSSADEDEDKKKIDPFEHLPAEEAEILKRQVDVHKPKVSYTTLYRYATKKDIVILIVGYFCSIVAGAALPMFTLVVGDLTQKFNNFFTSPNPDPNEFQNSVNHNTLYFLYLGIGIIVFTFIDTFIHVDRGEVLASRIRQHYLAGVLRQNTAYFDKLGAGEVTTRITNDTNAIQEGISEKAGLIANGIATFICAFCIGFAKNWKLAFILVSVVVCIVLVMGTGTFFLIRYTTRSVEAYGYGSTVAEETLSAIRTTLAFGSQNRLADKFDGHLINTMKHGIKKGRSMCVMVAGIWSTIFMSYALAFWQGSRFIAWGETDVGSIIAVIMSMMIGAFVLGNVSPSFQAIGKALASASKIFEAIDRVPHIDSDSDEGKKLDTVRGHIELKDIKFIYPSRPDVTVLEHMDLEIKEGETVALVGMSGSGKSTIVGLIERFYDPVRGVVTIDGHDISELNVKWLRQHISLVSQEPTLFAVSIYENITYGLIGTEHENASEEKKRELVTEACKQANAWDFIQNMTDGLDTNVGERGFLMSGGQKQRIAIARAIISQPKILLLDEATSALDTKSEGIVQDALDRAAEGRTTIVIAHRLSTIKDADKIVVMSKGKIVEMGSHSDLISEDGAYARLVDAQRINAKKKEEEGDEEGEGEHGSSESDEQQDPKQFVHDDDDDNPLEKTATSKSVSSKVLEGMPEPGKAPKRSPFYLFKMVSLIYK